MPNLNRLAERPTPPCLLSTTRRGNSSHAWGPVGGPLLNDHCVCLRGASSAFSLGGGR